MTLSSPQSFKSCRVCRRVNDGVPDVPVSQIVLNEPRICPLVGQGEAASVAQHVRMGGQGQPGQLSIFPDRQPGGAPVKRLPVLAHKKRPAGRFHFGALGQPCFDNAQLVGA